MRIVAIVQARMGSTRLPNKVMMKINDIPMIEILLSRLSRSEEIDEIVLATSSDNKNAPLVDHVQSLGYRCVLGSEDNVLQRFVDAARVSSATSVVRITGDCPLVDPAIVDECIRSYRKEKVDYFGNTDPATYPDGLDVEVVSTLALERALLESKDSFDLEHVTPYIRNSEKFSKGNLECSTNFACLRWTVDEISDMEVIKRVFHHFLPDIHFGWERILELQRAAPELFQDNQKIRRNEGSDMGTGQKLWRRAKRIIPGGNMLLSKRSEMFLPDLWPSYFSKAKGCKVWDLDGNEFIDMSIMGIGTNILGYGNPEVDAAVRTTIDNGNMSSLNCPEEVYLAEKLVELHPWSEMVRLARSGGESNAIAIRIARAASGKDKVAICGYHGWHDWYLSANLGDEKNLDGHLLPGLDPNGVPRDLKGSVLPFNYNNISELESLVSQHDIGVIKMEVVRNQGPEDNFLHKVRKLATENNIVLVFDECTSGFRETFGGLHKKYNVEPDIAIFGKALGNGYGITAIIGTREVMEAAQSTFISSTFWTERIGPTAALKTLEVMEQLNSWEKISATGIEIREGWKKAAQANDLTLHHWGLPALTGFSIESENALAYKTLITQEMLKKGYLAANSVYVCTEHSSEVLEGYFEAVAPLFALIGECENGSRDIATLLDSSVCHAGFKRLN